MTLNNQMAEKAEAKKACQEALHLISEAKQILSDTETASLFDLFGGGIFTSLLKRSKIDELNKKIASLQVAMITARRELSDIAIEFDSSISNKDEDLVFDVFLDNIFTDISVHEQLKSLGKNLDLLENQLKDYLENIQ